MEINKFLKNLIGIGDDFDILTISTDELNKEIFIKIKYISKRYNSGGIAHHLYDLSPERSWQHLSWFEYKCFIVCRLPRYITEDGKVKVIDIDFAPKSKGYTHKFSALVVTFLEKIRVQSTVASLLNTSSYIVRSIMNNAVNEALEARGFIKDFKHVSLDEKSYRTGHEYATILIDKDQDRVLNLVEGRKEKSVKVLFFELNEEEKQPQIEIVNIDMWKAYMSAMREISPYALQVHDKFHLIKKLSESIDNTRKEEVITQKILVKQKYTVLKNAENRTDNQNNDFDTIQAVNLKTAQAWVIRENFKQIYSIKHWQDRIAFYDVWLQNATDKALKHVDKVLKTFKNHREGILNALITKTDSGSHENLNGRIQSVLAKARGFANFDRFKVNVMFYFGKLQFSTKYLL